MKLRKTIILSFVLVLLVSTFDTGIYLAQNKTLEAAATDNITTKDYTQEQTSELEGPQQIQNVNTEQVLEGILIDSDCSGTSTPEKHTKACNLMPGCAASGYGIDVKQADGTYKFYKFNDNGQKIAKDILNKTTRTANLTIRAKGTLQGTTFKVSSIEEDLREEFKGILIDAHCSGTSDPAKHAKACNLMLGCAASGYGVDIKQPNGAYKFYKFDDNGQKIAKNILSKTTRTSNLTIIVKGALDGNTIKVSSIVEDIPVAVSKEYNGWLADSKTGKNVSDPTNVTKASLVNNDYGIILEQPDYSFKFYKFDGNGQKLAKANIINKTSKVKDLRIKVNGVIDDTTNTIKISTIQEEQELIGIILTKSTFEKSSNPSKVKRDEIVTADSEASGYGIAVKQKDGKYKFYKFDEAGNKKGKNVLSWYVKWADNTSNIPVLVQGRVDGNNIITSYVYRERYIPGQLSSKYLFDQDKPLKDITRADLLSAKSVASGYGYYVHSCGGHEFFPFDKSSNELIKKFIEKSKTKGEIKVIPKGFWYWIGNTIKINSITEDFKAEATPEEPVNEEISGLVATRSYFKSSEYQKLEAPGTITKGFLLDSKNAASGYGIIYNTCCGYGYLRFDANGTKLIKDIIKNSKETSNIKVIVKGKRDGDTIYVTSIIKSNEKTYSGTLVKSNSKEYGINVKQPDGKNKFYRLDSNGSYYHESGQSQAKELLEEVKKSSTTVDVKGTLDGNTLIVSSIEENLKIPSTNATLKSIAITKPAKKLVYSVGESLDISGLEVKGTYSDNKTSVLPITAANIKGFNSSKPAVGQVLTITVGGKTTTYKITIKSNLQTFTGYIEDEDCFVYFTDPANKTNPSEDTKGCLAMKSCAASGYGIAVHQKDGTYKFYYFDGNFAPNAASAQIKAANLIKNTKKNDHISITVKGELSGQVKTAPDGKKYPVIIVSSIVEN